MSSNLQVILLFVFSFLIIVAVLIFGGFIPGLGGQAEFGGEVTLWGQWSESTMLSAVEAINQQYEKSFKLVYVQKDRETFSDTLVEALAAGQGPDLILLPQDLIFRHSNKIFALPYDNYSPRQFKDAFVEEGEIYLGEGGVLGFPLLVDPLVMYWNRDLFSSSGAALPPKFWDEFITLSPQLTQLGGAKSQIDVSAVALGTFDNVENAKEILMALVLQTGEKVEELGPGASSAINFYTEFANPAKSLYSWNAARPNSTDAFTQKSLAVYFGFGSEVEELKARNPHLNFDSALFPQIRPAAGHALSNTTFARMEAVSVMKNSSHPQAAFQAALALTSPEFAKMVSEGVGLPPARRDLLSQGVQDPHLSLLYRSAVAGRGWLDPDPPATSSIFRQMVQSILLTGGRLGEPLSQARSQIQALYEKQMQ